MRGQKSSNRMGINEYRQMVRGSNGRLSEKPIERAILEYLELIGITAWKQNNGAFKVEGRFIRIFMDARGDSVTGISDIGGWVPGGRGLYIEVKRPGEKPNDDQKSFLKNAKDSGCVAFVARSIDDVTRNLKAENVSLKVLDHKHSTEH